MAPLRAYPTSDAPPPAALSGPSARAVDGSDLVGGACAAGMGTGGLGDPPHVGPQRLVETLDADRSP
eukprot:2370378-Alexandrium_andersonii.AAC.1